MVWGENCSRPSGGWVTGSSLTNSLTSPHSSKAKISEFVMEGIKDPVVGVTDENSPLLSIQGDSNNGSKDRFSASSNSR